jgi:ClpP class serine protease
MDKVGVGEDVVKSGKWKDFWSPFRPATPQEKEMMNYFFQGRNLASDKKNRRGQGIQLITGP